MNRTLLTLCVSSTLMLTGCGEDLTELLGTAPIYLDEAAPVATFSPEEALQPWESPDAFAPFARYEVKLFRFTYQTRDTWGHPVRAAAAVLVPQTEAGEFLPLLAYFPDAYLTDAERPGSGDPASVARRAVLFAAAGHVTVVPDYLPAGESTDSLTPYYHANSLGARTYDALLTAQEFAEREAINVDRRLFLVGWGHGAYAAAATQRLLETRYSSTFELSATAIGGGAYDVYNTTLQVVRSADRPIENPWEHAWRFVAYDRLYNWNRDLGEVFNDPVAVREALAGVTPAAEDRLGSLPSELYTERFLNELLGDGEGAYRQALLDNNLHRWIPKNDLRVYHGNLDRRASLLNARDFSEHAQTNGATNVTLYTLEGVDHETARTPFALGTLQWFGQRQ
ncbi:MAG: hypothetical protein WBA12_15540 [Catalinimonas sp.]